MQLLSHHYGYAGDGAATTPDSAVVAQVELEAELVRQLKASGVTKKTAKQAKKTLLPQLKELQRVARREISKPLLYQKEIMPNVPLTQEFLEIRAGDFGTTQEVFVDVRTRLKNIWSNRKESNKLREQALTLAQTLELIQGSRLGEARDLIAQKAPNVQNLLATTNWEEWARTQAERLGLLEQTEILLGQFQVATTNATLPEQSEQSLVVLSTFDPALEITWKHMKAQKFWVAAGFGAVSLWIIRRMYLNRRDQ